MKVVVLAGGNSTERDVSIETGYLVAASLNKKKYEVMLIDVFWGTDKKGFWVTEDFLKAKEEMIRNSELVSKIKRKSFFGDNVLEICKQADIVFLALHGKNGEDGKIQATLELLGIKYTGSNFLSSILAMDKSLTKLKFKEGEILTSNYFVLDRNSKIPVVKDFPKVVKAVCGGSSIGVYIANNESELKSKVKEVLKIDDRVLVEDYIRGREFSVGFIKNKVLPIVEIEPVKGFYDYKNKYTKGNTIETCPAKISKELENKLKKVTLNVAKTLGIDTYARVDFIVNDKNEVYCLEVNTLPGMTETSLLPMEALAMKVSYEKLCEKLIEVSIN